MKFLKIYFFCIFFGWFELIQASIASDVLSNHDREKKFISRSVKKLSEEKKGFLVLREYIALLGERDECEEKERAKNLEEAADLYVHLLESSYCEIDDLRDAAFLSVQRGKLDETLTFYKKILLSDNVDLTLKDHLSFLIYFDKWFENTKKFQMQILYMAYESCAKIQKNFYIDEEHQPLIDRIQTTFAQYATML